MVYFQKFIIKYNKINIQLRTIQKSKKTRLKKQARKDEHAKSKYKNVDEIFLQTKSRIFFKGVKTLSLNIYRDKKEYKFQYYPFITNILLYMVRK